MEPNDDDRLRAYATELADGIDAALPGWVRRAVERVVAESGVALDPEAAARLDEGIDAAGEAVLVEVGAAVRALLTADVDEQRANPLALLRGAVRHPTRLLEDLGVPPVNRDAVAVEQFPDDPYDLTPGGFGDIDPALHDAGITWGAAKAHVVLSRRRSEGLR